MSLQWELEFEVSWRPRQVVYIRIKADISALTYPNKGQPLCYPASAGGGAGGGDRGRKEERAERKEGVQRVEDDRKEGRVSTGQSSFPQSSRRGTS